MKWQLFRSDLIEKHLGLVEGPWFFKHAKKRPAGIFSKYRQLEDLWSQLCTLELARLVGIKTPDVYLMIPLHWDHIIKDKHGKSSISAALFSHQLDGFLELSVFYKDLLKTKKAEHIYHHPHLFLSLLTKSQKKALGQLLATALWLGHWDLANNVDFSNSGFYEAAGIPQAVPAMVDGGNALDEGFHGYRKVETISLFVNINKENQDGQHEFNFATKRENYEHLAPFDENIYPLLPRFLFDQMDFFWTDDIIVSGFIDQASTIQAISKFDINQVIRQCWRKIVDADGLYQTQSCAVLKKALRLAKSRWSPYYRGKNIIDNLCDRANNIGKLAKKIKNSDEIQATLTSHDSSI
tara:strand:+ start:457 stop:1512 length:1056 start_codon:yes stop_codon:yes gene_type:complete